MEFGANGLPQVAADWSRTHSSCGPAGGSASVVGIIPTEDFPSTATAGANSY